MSHFKPLCDCFVQLILWYRQQNCLDRLHNTLFNCLITAISERQTGQIVFISSRKSSCFALHSKFRLFPKATHGITDRKWMTTSIRKPNPFRLASKQNYVPRAITGSRLMTYSYLQMREIQIWRSLETWKNNTTGIFLFQKPIINMLWQKLEIKRQ